MDKLRLGISSCLLGMPVRYDGGHKLDHYLRDTLGQYFEFVPICPEVECGLGVPREAVRLVGDAENPRLITVRSKQDLTDRMAAWAAQRVGELSTEQLCGFIFKSGSPSSGMERVKVYNEKGTAGKNGVGLFARVFMNHFPNLPAEEEGRLNDPILRENFIERIFSCARWQEIVRKKGLKLKDVMDFHTANKLLILAHSPQHYRELGRLVAGGKEMNIRDLISVYERWFMEGMKRKATPSKNANVLMHMVGYFKKELSAWEKGELLDLINQYRMNVLPLIVPVTLLKHYVAKYDQSYLQGQTYLNPHPLELRLRNHV